MTPEQGSTACGCCEGITRATPQDPANPPGQTALTWRVGTHGRFKAAMLAGLAGPGGLPALATRADDDPAIALLDAAAVMLDVLTFYQERIANEGYLRTATERQSVLELVRAIGYELRPGVAAGTWLAFEMETAPSAPATALIPVGTRVQSLPGQDERPQTFETVEPITARRDYNRIGVQTHRPVRLERGTRTLYLQGTATNLKPGDALLILGDERRGAPGDEHWDVRRVAEIGTVTPATGAPYTVVTLDRGLGSSVPRGDPAQHHPTAYALRQRANFFGYNAPDWRAMPNTVKAGFLGIADPAAAGQAATIALYNDWPGLSLDHVAAGTGLTGEYYAQTTLTDLKLTRVDPRIDFAWQERAPAAGVGADGFSVRWTGWIKPKVSGNHVFSTVSDDGVRLWVDGTLLIDRWNVHAATTDTAPPIALTAGQRVPIRLEYYENAGAATIQLYWSAPGLTAEIVPATALYPSTQGDVYLDAIYGRVLRDSWAAITTPQYLELYRIQFVAEDARADFTLSAKTTRLTLSGENLYEKFNTRIRDAVILAQSEELPLAPVPVTDPVDGDTIVLDGLRPGLTPGLTLIVTGKRIRVAVAQAVEILTTDGTDLAVLAVGDQAVLEETPQSAADGTQRWTLTDKTGLTGVATLASAATAAATFQPLPAAEQDPLVSEVVTIKRVTPGSDPTEIVLTGALRRRYDRATLFIYGNVARATHGETRHEVLGSGDASRGFQRFTLKQKPLTYVAAATPGGAASTLEVRVNDIRWGEVPSLYDLPARERAYIARLDDGGNVVLTFGDGTTGARLPAGDENIVATYRIGIGTGGMVRAGQLSLPMTRPLGVQKVTNPLAPTGAADPEPRDQARALAPLSVLTLGRIVSLRDFEDFARAFAGIGKAQATWLWDGERRIVYVTVAAAAGRGTDYTLDPQSDLAQKLRLAMDGVRDTVAPLTIASYAPLFFRLQARLVIDPDYRADLVLAAAQAALQQAYAFASRDFAQPVHAGEVLGVMQAVAGVTAVFLDQLHLLGGAGRQTPLPAAGARLDAGAGAPGGPSVFRPAQLLLLHPQGIDLTEVKP